jgi:protein-disulfide isomerase
METKNNNYSIPLAIIIAGIIISGAVIYSKSSVADKSISSQQKVERKNQTAQASTGIDNIKPVTADEHILGNPDALVKIVEFSDMECPYCKKFQTTMHQIMDEYGKNGKVAWVYRHFPIIQRHPKAPKEAQATECAAEIGGNTAFWKYLNRVFELTPGNNGFDLAKLPEVAEFIGLDRTKFEECLESGKYIKKVDKNLQDAISSGGKGTPYSIVIASNGNKIAINGAQSYEFVKTIIENALK